MRVRFQFRRYRLPFQVPIRTAHGPWTDREGLLVRIVDVSEGGSGRVGYGEAAPIPWFGTETVDEDEAAARGLGEWIETTAFEAVPSKCRCLRNAIAAALAEPTLHPAVRDQVTVAALLPAGRAALPLIEPRAEIGFRVFKWKVGVADVADELVLLDDVCARLPKGAKLRLDANGAWDRKRAQRWMERAAERPVEFIEQPCFSAVAEGATAQRRVEDVLMGLANDFPTPIALDESIVGDGDVEHWLQRGWPGIFVVKPSMLADVSGALAALHKAKASVVFSSALETPVGTRAALRAAFAWPGEARAVGFGVWPLFADYRFDAGAPLPFLRKEDVERIDPETTWNALS